jgi:small subunit ribosomal protein S2
MTRTTAFPLQTFLDVQAYSGHPRWHPATSAFCLGERSGLSLLNPSYTQSHLGRALLFLTALAQAEGTVLFVATRGDAQGMVSHLARQLGHRAVTTKWIGGTLTNWAQVQATKGDLRAFPDAVFIVNPADNQHAIREAQKMHLPVIALMDSSTSPEGIDYLIPGNDESDRFIYSVLHTVARVFRRPTVEA